MSKKILILRACGHDDEPKECDSIKSQAELYGWDVEDYCPKSNDELTEIVNSTEEIDFIYLSSHGDVDGFSNKAETVKFSWSDFSLLLCESFCMSDDCIIMLSCCRGGLDQVAYELFYSCADISYVIGPRQNLCSDEMLISYNLLLYTLKHRNNDPVIACEKIKAGTDIRFVCFDKLETVSQPGYIMWLKQREEEEEEEADTDELITEAPPSLS